MSSAAPAGCKIIAVTALKDLNWVGIQSWLTQNGATPASVKYTQTIDRSQVQNLIDIAAKYGALKSSFPAADLLLPDR